MKLPKDYIKIWSREYAVDYCEASLRSFGHDGRGLIPAISRMSFMLPEQENMAHYSSQAEYQRIMRVYLRSTLSLKRYQRFVQQLEKVGREHIKIVQKVSRECSTYRTSADWRKAYELYFTSRVRYTSVLWIGWMINEAYVQQFSDYLWKLLMQNGKESEFSDILSVVTQPRQDAGMLALKKELLKYRNQRKIPEKVLQNLVHRYAWVGCLVNGNKPWGISEITHYFSTLSKKQTMTTPKEAMESVLQRLSLTKHDRDRFYIVNHMAYLKDRRDDIRRMGVYHARPFVQALAKVMHLSLQEWTYLTSDEIKQFFYGDENLDLKERSHKRQAGLALSYFGKKFVVYSGSSFKHFLKLTKPHILNARIKEIKGINASPGQVRGRAIIVKTIKDLKKIKKGDIMVAITTHPDYTPSMMKCSAIVTDEGGLISHATIIARELKIPCIVGTKTATQVLKDGDMIEVDGKKGIVTKL